MYNNQSPIGVFDSGLGGLSVLTELNKLMPYENYLYLGDSANAPYGSKSSTEIEELVLINAAKLMKENCKCLVIACNTATAAAILKLRQLYTNIPIIGIEPAIKPAAEYAKGGNILVLATSATLSESKFKNLLSKHTQQAQIHTLAAVGLVEYIENGDFDSPILEDFLVNLLTPFLENKPQAIVLGCTHYPFVKPLLTKLFGPKVFITDGGNGTARETKRQLEAYHLLANTQNKGSIIIHNSLPDKISLSYTLLNLKNEV